MAEPVEIAHSATDESWERLLVSIDPLHADRIHMVLQWLAFGNEPLLNDIPFDDPHPLTLLQIAEVVSVDHSHPLPSYQEDGRMSPDRIAELSSGLLKLEEVSTTRY